jgi:hypothetical protein
LAAQNKPPEGATVDLYEAMMLYTTASRIIEAYREDERLRCGGSRPEQK